MFASVEGRVMGDATDPLPSTGDPSDPGPNEAPERSAGDDGDDRTEVVTEFGPESTDT
jgi:hypothetical protein